MWEMDRWINGEGGGCKGKGYVDLDPSKITGGGEDLPLCIYSMQVSQFSSTEIICLLSFVCGRVSCSHGLSLDHPNNEHQPLATLSYNGLTMYLTQVR